MTYLATGFLALNCWCIFRLQSDALDLKGGSGTRLFRKLIHNQIVLPLQDLELCLSWPVTIILHAKSMGLLTYWDLNDWLAVNDPSSNNHRWIWFHLDEELPMELDHLYMASNNTLQLSSLPNTRTEFRECNCTLYRAKFGISAFGIAQSSWQKVCVVSVIIALVYALDYFICSRWYGRLKWVLSLSYEFQLIYSSDGKLLKECPHKRFRQFIQARLPWMTVL